MQTNTTMRVVNTELFRNAAAITLSFNKKWGNSRKVPIDQAQQPGGVIRRDMTDEEKKEIKRRLKLSTNLIISKEYDEIGAFHSVTKKAILATCVNSRFKKGFYLAKVAKIDETDKLIADANKKLKDELVPAFIKAFPAQQEEARLVMEPKGMYREQDYPDPQDLENCFFIEHYWVAFGTPDNLPAEVREREAAKMGAKFAEVEQEIIFAAREGFAALVGHLVERLQPGADGKAKTFQKGTVENLVTFINTFANRNLLNDGELDNLVEKARNAIAFVTPQGLRDSIQLRKSTSAAFEEIKAEADKMIVDRPGRKFAFDEEDAA